MPVIRLSERQWARYHRGLAGEVTRRLAAWREQLILEHLPMAARIARSVAHLFAPHLDIRDLERLTIHPSRLSVGSDRLIRFVYPSLLDMERFVCRTHRDHPVSGTATVASGSGATVASASHTHTDDPTNLVVLPYFRL
jgi:hypothetical protein